MKKTLQLVLVVGLLVGLAQVCHAGFFGFDVKSNVNANSNNKYDHSTRVDDSTIVSTTNNNQDYNSHNRTYTNQDYNSHNTSNVDSHAIADSYNTTSNTTSTYSGNTYDSSAGKRVASHDIVGDFRNSIGGDFNQNVGADFSGGFSGSASTFDASTVNTQTFGDVNIMNSGE